MLVDRMADIKKKKNVYLEAFSLYSHPGSTSVSITFVSILQRGHSMRHDKYPDDVRPFITCLEVCCVLL